MALERWTPGRCDTEHAQFILSRLAKKRKLFAFLYSHRLEIFDDAFQEELESMYRDSGAGKEPTPPAVLAMALLLQAYMQVSDADAVEATALDLRWQLVLDCLGAKQTLFSQGTLFNFRERMIAHDMDRRLLEHTVEVAKRTKGFDPRKFPKSLRIAMDSAPLEGAGRVEDTLNLLAHAGRTLARCAATLRNCKMDEVCREAGSGLLLASSVKAGLDLDWTQPEAQTEAINRLLDELAALERWIEEHFAGQLAEPPLKEHIETLHQIIEQDLEPDPSGGGGARIRHGVAEDRRVSITEPEMRHGRKTKSKRFNGYKRHIALDLDSDLTVGCALTPANMPEHDAAEDLKADIERLGHRIGELHVDRGYINSSIVPEVLDQNGDIICRPWHTPNGPRFAKSDFLINISERTITCPEGQVQTFQFGQRVQFPTKTCRICTSRSNCTVAAPSKGRTVNIAQNEALQQRLREAAETPQGRIRLRQRVPVEHKLAHTVRRQGKRSRFRGHRKNLFDLRRVAAVGNLQVIQRKCA